MKSAIVESYSRAPRYGEFADPVAQAGQQLVTVHAAALAPLTKSITAAGTTVAAIAFLLCQAWTAWDGLKMGSAFTLPFRRRPTDRWPSDGGESLLCVALPDELDDLTAAVAANPECRRGRR